jgi:two-component system response regulator
MKTILQVEDDPNDVFLFQHAMTKSGLPNPVQVASDGQEAIDYLQGVGKFANRDRFPFPNLVLLDLKLPYVMGLDVLKWIREQTWGALPVVMLTASAEEADIAAAYRLGANAFLTKPSAAGKLEDMVKAINHFWLTHNALPQKSSPGSPMNGVVSLFHPKPALAAKRRPPPNGTRREVWPHNLEANP